MVEMARRPMEAVDLREVVELQGVADLQEFEFWHFEIMRYTARAVPEWERPAFFLSAVIASSWHNLLVTVV
jgi:hypothetical protein